MKKGKVMVLLIGLLAIASAAAVLIFKTAYQKEQKGYGLFSWDFEAISEEEAEQLTQCIEEAQINRIFQEFSDDMLESGDASAFVGRMQKLGVEVYALMGSAEWALEPEGNSLIKEMSRIAEYNRTAREENRIVGIIADVEPYLLEEWDAGDEEREELMESYLSCMEAAYDYVGKKDLRLLLCIPTFFDITNRDILERLIYGACDGAAVMNYNRTDEYGQIAMEVGYAREYGKELICIYELQEAGEHGLEEINTYAEAGIHALWRSVERLEKQFGYEKLSFAYHYYKPLKELLEY